MDGTPGLQSGTFAGRYTIERELGRGATATVYLARDTQRGHAVAIKVLRPELAESLGADRFLKEIKVNERLHHPHIASVLDSGQHEGQLYFVLPHMEGGSLRGMLEREKQLPIEAAVSITRTIALALDYAHKQGLIHRDVKPENILFTSGQACLADFGIARAIERAIDETTTSTGLVRGTPAYMSPEQASGSTTYDGRSDQYSLACVLYEMLAGVPAFIGPTPEAVIAMRFQHPPRNVRVYRATVPPALEAVIDRALSLVPADRYASMREFADAMDSALRAPIIEPRTSGASAGFIRSRRWPLIGASVIAVVALTTVSIGLHSIFTGNDVPLDTAAYLVLPVETDSATAGRVIYDGLLQKMSQWTGVTIVDRFTARTQLSSDTLHLISETRAAAASRALGAGRYVRSRIMRTPAGARLYGAVFDAHDGSRIYEATVGIPVSADGLDSVLTLLANRLLFRESPAPAALRSRIIQAAQLYSAALKAREAFNLRRADSLLVAALEADHDFAQGMLALAEVRAWREEPVANWLTWVDRAAATGQLTTDEQRLASALAGMARPSIASSCQLYRRLAADHTDDLAAWYGFATCLRRDNVVIRDPESPSGWRFRTSYQEAVNAYVRAFALAPALHRTFQPGGYDRLRRLLLAGNRMLRAGVAAAPDSTRFFAYATWRDSLVLIPWPASAIGRGAGAADITSRELAVQKQREVFREVARTWAVALPTNPATKEVVAISLEMLGDVGALDTLRLARALATDPDHMRRLAAEEVLMRVSFGRRNAQYLNGAIALADSLLNTATEPSTDVAATLAPVAAMLGRCRLAGALAALGATNARYAAMAQVSLRAYAAAESLTVTSALGCDPARDSAAVAFVSSLVYQTDAARPDSTRARLEYGILARAIHLSNHMDSSHVRRFARAADDRVLVARLELARGHSFDARRILADQLTRQSADQTPDVTYAEARLLTQLQDTTKAAAILDPPLNRVSWLDLLLDRPVDAAALVRAAALRAEIAYRRHDTVSTDTWASFVARLWSTADPPLRNVAHRMEMLRDTH